jgi:RND family efflux transporter MFP subunit
MRLLVAALASTLAVISGCSRPVDAEHTDKGAGDEAPRVEVSLPTRETLAQTITLPASIDAFEKARLYAKVAGYVDRIYVDIGDRVTRGQVLAELDIPEMAPQYAEAKAQLAEAQAEHARAAAEDELQRVIYERSRSLRRRASITEQDLDQAKASHRRAAAEVALAQARIERLRARLGELETMMEYAKIRAPFDGVVTERFVDPGALVQAATASNDVSPVVTVQRLDKMRVVVAVPEREAAAVEPGKAATLTANALPTRQFAGTVSRCAGALDPATRTMRVEIDVPTPEAELKPGMYGSLTLTLAERDDALTVPASAVVAEKDRRFVYVVREGHAHKVPVTIGADDAIRVEVTSGLDADSAVVVSGLGALADGAAVRAEPRATSGERSAS